MKTLLLSFLTAALMSFAKSLRCALFCLPCFFLAGATATAQPHHTDAYHGLDYVQGPEYKVIDTPDGLRLFWRGEPLRRDQARRTGEYEFVVLDEDGQDRLIVRLNEDESLDRVIDLKYTDRPADKAAPDPDNLGASVLRREVEVVFKNGLVFRYENGQATAELPGVELRLEGQDGRYRIYGPDFEAGVSFGREDKPVYRYFTPIRD